MGVKAKSHVERRGHTEILVALGVHDGGCAPTDPREIAPTSRHDALMRVQRAARHEQGDVWPVAGPTLRRSGTTAALPRAHVANARCRFATLPDVDRCRGVALDDDR